MLVTMTQAMKAAGRAVAAGDFDLPDPGMIVAQSGGGKGKTGNAPVEVVSHSPLEKLSDINAATWLDHTIVAAMRRVIHEKGFGAQRYLRRSLLARLG
jgi:Protein of unknown function (DUF3363)